MITQNLHMHSTWDDGKCSVEEMILASKAAGLSSVGISVHAPMIFGTDWACPREKLGAYQQEVREMKEKYKEAIDVYLGVEWDVFSDIDLEPYDYVIGSAHCIPVPMRLPENCPAELAAMFHTDYPSVDESAEATERMLKGCFDGDADTAAEAYFAQLERVADEPHAQIVGHFDLLTKFDETHRFFNENSPRYEAAARRAMEKLVKAGKIFEVNTGAISRGYRTTPYPSVKWLKLLHEMSGRVTVSADAHHTSGVTCAFDLAEKMINEAGFNEIWVLEGKEFIPMKI